MGDRFRRDPRHGPGGGCDMIGVHMKKSIKPYAVPASSCDKYAACRIRGTMRRIIVLAVISFILAMLPACDNPIFYQDMVYMDRAFVAALQLTSAEGDMDKGVLALSRLKMRWNLFSDGYREYITGDMQWRDTFDLVGDKLEQAARDAQSGGMSHAHELLLEIRDLLHDARVRNNLPYIMDYFTEYQETLELLVAASSDGVIDDAEFEGISHLAPEAIARWNRIAKYELDDYMYEFDSGTRETYDEAIRAEAEILSRLLLLHEQGNRRDMLKVIDALSLPYKRAFTSLGYYDSLK